MTCRWSHCWGRQGCAKSARACGSGRVCLYFCMHAMCVYVAVDF
jgi:hypothetical protein